MHSPDRSSFAIEMEETYCASLRRRGIGVDCRSFEQVPDSTLATVEVFFWFVFPPTLSEGWLRRLWKLRRPANITTTVLIGFDSHMPPEMRYLPLLTTHYYGSVHRLFYDEGGPLTGHNVPSYAHEHMYRPGRWGVFHVAKFVFSARQPRRLPPLLNHTMSDAVMIDLPGWGDWRHHGWQPGTRPMEAAEAEIANLTRRRTRRRNGRK